MAKQLLGAHKAVQEYKKYNANGLFSPEYGYLMLDCESGELWTDYFYSLGHNMWKEYHNDSIVNLGSVMQEQSIEVNEEYVIEFAGRLVH